MTDAELLAPYSHITRQPGKAMRLLLIDAFNTWFNAPKEKVDVIKSVTEKLHNSSLLIDDIEDNSCLRRGNPTAHQIYGIATTINCANFVYFLAMQEALQLASASAVEVFIREMVNLHRGQGLDIHWRDHSICPTEEDYKQMVSHKTGGLFRLTVGLMQEFSEDKRDYTALLNNFAVYFQILDDYLNLQSTNYHNNKSFCEDITEGKYSFPILHCIQHTKADPQMEHILKQRTSDRDLKEYCLKLMTASGSFTYTETVLHQLYDELNAQVESFGGNPTLTKIFSTLHKQLTSIEDSHQKRENENGNQSSFSISDDEKEKPK